MTENVNMSHEPHNSPRAASQIRDVLRIRPTGAALGAEVQGVDLRALDDDTFAAVHRAWLDDQVLLFRDQNLTDHDLAAFSRRFGHLDETPLQENGRPLVGGHPGHYAL